MCQGTNKLTNQCTDISNASMITNLLAILLQRSEEAHAFPVKIYLVGFRTSLVPRLLCMGGEKRAWYTLFVHAQFPRDFWAIVKYVLLH